MLRWHTDKAGLSGLPDPNLLQRVVSYRRSKRLPAHPKNLKFTIEKNFLPEIFWRADMRVDDARHLMFSTDAGWSY